MLELNFQNDAMVPRMKPVPGISLCGGYVRCVKVYCCDCNKKAGGTGGVSGERKEEEKSRCGDVEGVAWAAWGDKVASHVIYTDENKWGNLIR